LGAAWRAWLGQNQESVPRVDGKIEDLRVELTALTFELIKPEPDEIHYLVSSRRSMLASPCFRCLLTRDASIETLKHPSDGRYHITAGDWDKKALFILLNIFNVRTRQILLYVSLEMLRKIAVLVDYYELESAEVMERDTRDWIAGLRRNVTIPSCYCRDLMLWICTSHLFSMCEEFKKATAVAIKECQGWLQTLDFPLHQ
jgi:hypothetical protein